MKLKLFGVTITTKKVVEVAHDFALTEVDKAVAALKKTTIGATVAADIKTIGRKDLTGEQKFAEVLRNTLPALAAFASGDGVEVAVKEVEDVARALVQSVFNDVASSKAGTVAQTILKLLGFTK